MSKKRPPSVAHEKRIDTAKPYILELAVFSSIVKVGASKFCENTKCKPIATIENQKLDVCKRAAQIRGQETSEVRMTRVGLTR